MRPVATHLAGIWGAIVDAVFPQACLGCRALVPEPKRQWCNTCLADLLKATSQAYCPRCGRSTGPYEVVDGRCNRCSQESLAHAGLVRVGAYSRVITGLIRQYKFAGQQRLDAALGRLLADAIEGASWRDHLNVLVPVPSHWTVRRKRGFFSTGALTKEAARRLDVPFADILRRPHRGRSQIGLSATDRRVNVRGAFVLHRLARVAGRTACLVDDVMVTGATIQENVRVLRKAGAKAVYVAVLARAENADAALIDV